MTSSKMAAEGGSFCKMHWLCCLPLFSGDHSTQNCVQGLDEVAWQVVIPQGVGDKIVVYGSKCICQVQTAYSDTI